MKQQLANSLESFKNHNNMLGNSKIDKIELFSGIKSSSYFLPDIFIGRTTSPEAIQAHVDSRKQLSWFVEIWIDKICVWRKSATNSSGEDLQQFENQLIDQIMMEIFLTGINSSWNSIKKMEEDRRNGI